MNKTGTTAVYIDTFNYKSAHEMFNASLLLMCSEIFGRVTCRTSRGSFRAISGILDGNIPANVRYKRAFMIGGEDKYKLLARYITGGIKNLWHVAAAGRGKVLIFPFNNIFSLRAINFASKIFRREIVIFCHGEMEGVDLEIKPAGLLNKLLIRFARRFFLNPKIKVAKGIRFVVLGDVIKDNLSKHIDAGKAERFMSIDHPYIFPKKTKAEKEGKREKTSFGTVGSLNSAKGLGNLEKFAAGIPSATKTKIDISVIGRMHGDTSRLKELKVRLPMENRGGVPREEFDRMISELDYILFFYATDCYRLTASGAIMDAVYHEKPIISLDNNYFRYIFGKFGEFGYLAGSVEEMTAIAGRIVSGEEHIHPDFAKIKTMLAPETIAVSLRKQLKDKGII